MTLNEGLSSFYEKHLPGGVIDGTMLKASCPFCKDKGRDEPGSMVVYLGARSYFAGYFRCLSRCVPGGFAPHFGRLKGIDPATVPGYDPDRAPYVQSIKFPIGNINKDIKKYKAKRTENIASYFAKIGVGPDTLAEKNIGYNIDVVSLVRSFRPNT